MTAPPVASAPPPEAPPPSLDALAARQVRLAPGMHELARGRGPLHLPKAERDTCVRVAFASATPTTLRLVDRGTVLAAATTADGALGEHGPVCFRRGAEPLLELSPDAGASAFVVWAAP